jgi:hypothetical protein
MQNPLSQLSICQTRGPVQSAEGQAGVTCDSPIVPAWPANHHPCLIVPVGSAPKYYRAGNGGLELQCVNTLQEKRDPN